MITPEPISGNLLTVGGVAIPELISYKVTEAKLWKDADRNMNGDIRATLIGVFPKIDLNLGVVNRSRGAAIAAQLDSAYFSVTYFDPSLNANRTADFYSADYAFEFQTKQRGLYKPTQITIIPVSKR